MYHTYISLYGKHQINKNTAQMGQRDGFTNSDLTKLARMYKCDLTQTNVNAVSATKPIINAIANGVNKNNLNNHQQFQFGRQLFNAYTSPEFWQRLFNSWAFPQPQHFRYPDRNYNDYGSFGFGY